MKTLTQREKARQLRAEQLVEQFNKQFKIGDQVRLRSEAHKDVAFRKRELAWPAFVASSLEPVAFFVGIRGYHSISEDFVEYRKVIRYGCKGCSSYFVRDPGKYCVNCEKNSLEPIYE